MLCTPEQKIKLARGLVKSFNLERICFCIIATLVALCALGVAVYFVLKGKMDPKFFYSMCVPGGALIAASGQILLMYRYTLKWVDETCKESEQTQSKQLSVSQPKL